MQSNLGRRSIKSNKVQVLTMAETIKIIAPVYLDPDRDVPLIVDARVEAADPDSPKTFHVTAVVEDAQRPPG